MIQEHSDFHTWKGGRTNHEANIATSILVRYIHELTSSPLE